MTEFELWQDDMPVASVEAIDRPTALREIRHYAEMYGQDGTVEAVEVIRIPINLKTGESHA